MNAKPCITPHICGVKTHRAGTICRGESAGATPTTTTRPDHVIRDAPPSLDTTDETEPDPTPPEFSGKGVRFYANTDEEGIRQASERIHESMDVFQPGHEKPISYPVTNNHDNWYGSDFILKDSNGYHFIQYAPAHNSAEPRISLSSDDLSEVVRYAADENGYEDDEWGTHLE